jgi:hypothetical protein
MRSFIINTLHEIKLRRSIRARDELDMYRNMGKVRSAYKILVGEPEGKMPFRRPRRRWNDNIKMGYRDIG